MEENSTPSEQPNEAIDETLCINCQTNKFEEGHRTKLCPGCRDAFIKYPIPKPIRWFAIGLAAVIIVSLVRTQHYISAAIHLGRAENAIENKQFVTAQNELAVVLKDFPDHLISNGDMLIASCYSMNTLVAAKAYQQIAQKSIEDQDFYQRIMTAMDYLNQSYPQDTVIGKKITQARQDKAKLLEVYNEIDKSVNDSLKAGFKVGVANAFYDLEDYGAAEDILLKVLEKNPGTYSALSLMSALKRNTYKFDEGLKYCDRMLEFNKEDVYAISQKARIELKRKHDHDAGKYADQAMKIAPDNDSALEAKAMVDFFAGKKKDALQSLAIIQRHESFSGDSTISNRLVPIINGSIIYR